jgi:wobble nucleotide-excising tRNase
VFDDPVSSLDQSFEEKVITRLIALSEDRQVLVFTHRLSFLGIMNHLAAAKLHQVHIRREPWGTGQPGDVPLFGKSPVAALNKLKNERVAKARKVRETVGYEGYYPLAKAICSDFRVLMERIVEFVFLADVIQRHRRDVHTKGKLGKLVKISSADCELVDEMMTKYSRYEHSQSAEAPVDVPKPAELEADIARVLDWHKDFSGRKLP